MTRVHVITHAIIETETDADIYGAVAEHLERQREHGTIKNVTIQHGDWEIGDHEPGFTTKEENDAIDGGIAFIELGDHGLGIPELQRLAMNTLAAIKRAEG